MSYATVAQLVEQLTRNEQVVRSNRISSSIYKAPSNALYSVFGGAFGFIQEKAYFLNFIAKKS